MQLKSLQDKKFAIETSFNSLDAQKKEYTDKIAEIESEMVRFQGEYRLIEELIKNFKKEQKNAK